MQDGVNNGPMCHQPTLAEGDRAMQYARRMFQRTLANWASDCLELRRQQITTPRWATEMSASTDLRLAA